MNSKEFPGFINSRQFKEITTARVNMLNNLRETAARTNEGRPLLIISHQATLTGAPAVAADLGRYLSIIGCNIVFLVIESGPEIETYKAIGETYLLSDFDHSPEKAAREIANKHSPFVVVCNTITTVAFAGLFKAEPGSPYCIGWIHEMPTVINSFFGGQSTVDNALLHCDRILFGSDFVLNSFADEYRVDCAMLDILPYIRKPPLPSPQQIPINDSSLCHELTSSPSNIPERLLILGCGTAEPRKGLDSFVRIASYVLNKYPNDIADRIWFEWYGCPSYNDNYVDFCKLDAKRLGIEKKISFNPVTPDFLSSLSSATLFLLPSREDPYPLVILDSMARQVPFVCFEDAGGAADLARIGAGTSVTYGDELAFAGQVAHLLDNPHLRRRMGAVGLKRVLKTNNWMSVISRFLGFINIKHASANHLAFHEEPNASSLILSNDRLAGEVVISPALRRVLVVSFGPPPLPDMNAVEGGGLRCWNLAKGLRDACNTISVTLAYPSWYGGSESPDDYLGVQLTRWHDIEHLISVTSLHDVIIISFCYGDYSSRVVNALRNDQRLILDCYVPIHVEMCARRSPNRDDETTAYEGERARWEHVLRKGDIYLCSNQNQVHYYRGILYQIGRLNPRNYDEVDPLLIAPFGISRDLPAAKAQPSNQLGVSTHLKKILWFGGVYPWFEIGHLFEAVEILNGKIPCALIVVGVRNPFNSHPDFVRLAGEIEDLARSDRYKDLVYLADWVKYQDRADWYLESDLTVMISANGVENEYAWRTRLVDYLWAGVHVATSGQDMLSQEMLSRGLASELDLKSPQSIADSLERALIRQCDSNQYSTMNGHELRSSLLIDRVGGDILNKLSFLVKQ